MMLFEPIPLSLALTGAPGADDPREAIARSAQRGFAWVQLDATQRGVRPRELDASARRDLAAAASRSNIRFSGLDLMIPSKDFADSQSVDRAVSAVIAATVLLGDLVRLGAARTGASVSVVLPVAVERSAVEALGSAADRNGVLIANHAVEPLAGVGVGIDPAMHLMAGLSPSGAALNTQVVAGRLSDASEIGRVPVGEGNLSVLEYVVALSTAGFAGSMVVDVRGLPDPEAGIAQAVEAWHQSVGPLAG